MFLGLSFVLVRTQWCSPRDMRAYTIHITTSTSRMPNLSSDTWVGDDTVRREVWSIDILPSSLHEASPLAYGKSSQGMGQLLFFESISYIHQSLGCYNLFNCTFLISYRYRLPDTLTRDSYGIWAHTAPHSLPLPGSHPSTHSALPLSCKSQPLDQKYIWVMWSMFGVTLDSDKVTTPHYLLKPPFLQSFYQALNYRSHVIDIKSHKW